MLKPSATSKRPVVTDEFQSVRARTLATSMGWMVLGIDRATNSNRGTRVVTAPICAQMEQMAEANRQVGRLWAMRECDADWDGRGAQKPDLDSLQAAELLIMKMATAGFEIPVASVGSEGRSTLFWDAGTWLADMEIEAGHASYVIKEGDQETYHEEEFDPEFMPPYLMGYFVRHAGRR